MNKERLLNIIRNFKNQKIIVFGDLMLDKYLWTVVDRISPEAPVQVAKVENETFALGGAANVANNLASLGVSVDLVGLIGNDADGVLLRQMLKERHIAFSGLVGNQRSTVSKTRVFCGNYQLLRIDKEDVGEIEKKVEKLFFNYFKNNLSGVGAIIFSDYAKHLISPKFYESIIKLAARNKIKTFADPTPSTFYKFKNVYLIKPNRKEAEHIVGQKISDNFSNLKEICGKLNEKFNANVVITLGKDGMAVLDGSKFFRLKTDAKEVYDVSGAGDTTIAVLTASIASGASLEEAAVISNICAGAVVAKLGTAICSFQELLFKIEQIPENLTARIKR